MEELRQKYILLLSELVQLELVNKIENDVFNYCELYKKYKKNSFVNITYIYEHKITNILNDLKNTKTEIQIDDNITSYDRVKQNEMVWGKINIKNNNIEVSKNITITSNLYSCYKCKKNNCYIYQIQTRGADEPMTTFILCMNCNNKWRN